MRYFRESSIVINDVIRFYLGYLASLHLINHAIGSMSLMINWVATYSRFIKEIRL